MSDNLPPGFVLDGAGATPPLPPGFELVKEAQKKGMDIFPQWAQDAVKYGPGFLKEKGKDAVRGLLSGLAGMGEAVGNIAGEGMRSPNVTSSPTPQQEINAALPRNPDETPREKVLTRGMEGVGGAAAMPLPGTGIARQLLAGGIGGASGQLGREFAETHAPNSPMLQNAADLGAGMFGGALAGWMTGPKQSVAEQELRKVSQGQNFDEAFRNASLAQRAGSTTATAAEMFPPGSSVMRLAERARSATPVNNLAAATENRPGDIRGLADEFLNRIRPTPVDPNVTANSAAGSATGAMQETKRLRGDAIAGRLAGETAPFQDVADLHTHLSSLAQAQARPDAGAAYRRVASALLDQTGQPITNVQQLSFALKSLKTAAKNPQAPTFNGAEISRVDLAHAIDAAESGLGQINPNFADAMRDFRGFSQGPMTAERVGPIGSLADKNPIIAGQTPITRLEGLLSGNSPRTVEGTARTLADPVMTGGNMTSATDIARALAQKKLAAGPLDPGAVIRGTEGSGQQANFEALLRAGGNNAAHTMEPLAVADRLQPFLKSAGNNEPPTMQALQYLIRPLRSLDMLTTGTSMTKMNTEVARLLADGSPSSIRRLQEISMFDPNVRRMLTGKAAAIPLVQGEQ